MTPPCMFATVCRGVRSGCSAGLRAHAHGAMEQIREEAVDTITGSVPGTLDTTGPLGFVGKVDDAEPMAYESPTGPSVMKGARRACQLQRVERGLPAATG